MLPLKSGSEKSNTRHWKKKKSFKVALNRWSVSLPAFHILSKHNINQTTNLLVNYESEIKTETQKHRHFLLAFVGQNIAEF